MAHGHKTLQIVLILIVLIIKNILIKYDIFHFKKTQNLFKYSKIKVEKTFK